eukprot:CAMPEP_0178999092 /NCGR_PEP_ID=MMETSP0795-20121207/9863_1 /TAXON_ID=88552 /ORGANISM="Amoebophrya sp., Strain Ameob2" /LENGTH=1155 /DNA_ID=CAMNT_0020691817 /DNA_START=345 /DNA_END=3812 /DNA_ORIENTATION=+
MGLFSKKVAPAAGEQAEGEGGESPDAEQSQGAAADSGAAAAAGEDPLDASQTLDASAASSPAKRGGLFGMFGGSPTSKQEQSGGSSPSRRQVMSLAAKDDDELSFDEGHLSGEDDSSWGASSEEIDRDRSQLASHPYRSLPWLKGMNYRAKEKEAEKYSVTKGEMLTFLNAYLWFLEAGGGIPFTISMWFIFVLLVNLHGDVEQTFSVKRTLSESVSGIVAHPLLGNAPRVAGSTQETVVNMHCDCNCQPREALDRGVMKLRGCELPDSNQFAFLDQSEQLAVHRIAGMVTGQAYTDFALESTRETIFNDKLNEIGDASKLSLNITSWDQVISVADSWFWLQHGLLPVIWRENQLTFRDVELPQILAGQPVPKAAADRPGRLMMFNQLIGGVRLQQKKLKSSGCPVNKDLIDWYGMECRSEVPLTAAYGPGTTARNLPFQPVPGKSGIFEAYFDIGRRLASAGGALEEVEHLLVPNRWIDENTEWLEFQAAFFNAQVRLLANLKVRFTFDDGGFMEKTITVDATSANLYPNFAYYLPDIIWLSMIGMLFQQELFEVLKARRNEYLKDYFMDSWNFLDWCTITLGIVMGALWFDMVTKQSALATQVAALPATPSQVDEQGNSVALTSIEQYHEEWGGIIDKIQEAADQQWIQYNLLFWYTLILMMRFFKAFQGQPRLSMLSSTLLACFYDMVHYLMIFFVVFVSYALGGHALFGSLLEDWSTVNKAVNTSFLALMGEFDFNEMFELSPVTATLWFWSFMIVMTFILLNLLIALIFDHYSSLKFKVGETKGFTSQAMEFIRELNWNMDWLLQRRTYLKLGILNPEMERLFKGTKSVEDIYEDFCTEDGEALTYGRKTVLTVRAEAREAARQAYETKKGEDVAQESPRSRRRRQREEGTTAGDRDGSKESGNADEKKAKMLAKSATQQAAISSIAQRMMDAALAKQKEGQTLSNSLASKRMSIADAAVLAKEIHTDEEKHSREEREKERLRTKIDVQDLEQQFNVEPRFARHLMAQCKKHVDDEHDHQEQRSNEMKQLVTDAESTLKEVDVHCEGVEEALRESMKLLVRESLKLDEVCQQMLQECIDLHPRVGLLVPRGCVTSWGERGIREASTEPLSPGGAGSPKSPGGGGSPKAGKLRAAVGKVKTLGMLGALKNR